MQSGTTAGSDFSGFSNIQLNEIAVKSSNLKEQSEVFFETEFPSDRVNKWNDTCSESTFTEISLKEPEEHYYVNLNVRIYNKTGNIYFVYI